MKATALTPEEQLGLADDLRNCVPEETLIRLTFEAVHATLAEHPKANEVPLPAGKPRVCLTLLIYGYAIGLLGSQEIADRISIDPHFLYLSAKTGISANDLRQLRRHERDRLHRALSGLLQLASAIAVRDRSQASRSAVQVLCQQAAQRRIDEAVLRDTMALDG